MPEGDTLAGIARKLGPALEGVRIDRATMRSRGRIAVMEARVVRSVVSRGKHLIVEVEDGAALVIHLGMRGRVRAYPRHAEPARLDWTADVALTTESRVLAVFHARCVEIARGGAARTPRLQRLGPDLLGEPVDWDRILVRARAPDFAALPLATLLLDQRVSAGIGNVYKSEALFVARLRPTARACALDDAELVGLFRVAADLMRPNVGRARDTVYGGSGPPSLWVYGRKGRPCRICGGTIELFRHGDHARSTYFCSRCQVRPKDE